jgi:hypothetical protein
VPPGDVAGLIEGLRYCVEHRRVLGANGEEMARAWTWQAACAKVAEVYRMAGEREDRPMVIDEKLYKNVSL